MLELFCTLLPTTVLHDAKLISLCEYIWHISYVQSWCIDVLSGSVVLIGCDNSALQICLFLSDLLRLECPTAGPALTETPPTCCCKHTETTKEWMLRRLRLLRKQHWWLDEQIVDNLPTPIKKGMKSTQLSNVSISISVSPDGHFVSHSVRVCQ